MALERVAAVALPNADKHDAFVARSTGKRWPDGETQKGKMTHEPEDGTREKYRARKNEEP